MAVALVTGSGGLVGSESVRHLVAAGYDVVGLDNDMRASFFGDSASTRRVSEGLAAEHPDYRWLELDIRDAEGVDRLFASHGKAIEVIVHAAAQPSHDWAASDPHTDFGVNATATLNLLESTRRHCPEATFVFASTNKVYGDLPNHLPLEVLDKRLELPRDHRWYEGIDTTMSIDRSMHSLFGVSKAAADLMVQEYGRYFEIPTVCFRCGCLTGPSHAGAMLHGFLSYLMRCAMSGERYTVFGYDGRQVRDNLHSADLARAFLEFHRAPRVAAVYNMGGGRFGDCSVLEAIEVCERITGRPMDFEISDAARMGDHRWWVSDLAEFGRDYPDWRPQYDVETILREIHEHNLEHWAVRA